MVVASVVHLWARPRREFPETPKARLLPTREFRPCLSRPLQPSFLSPLVNSLSVRTLSVSKGSNLSNVGSIRQDRTALFVSILGARSNLFIAPATDRVINHRKLVISEPQRTRDIPPRRLERVRTNDQCGFVVVFKGNTVMHTAR